MAGNENFNLSTNDESEDFTLEFGEVVNIGGGGGGTSDFNQLSNRPKYAGETMTGSTNIPAVPTKTSDLDNDSDYQTGSEVESAISEAIADKQDTLTAGDNITIEDNTISATDTTYTAGTNVSISNENVISATDTTYSNFTGTDGNTAGTSGLVPAPATTDAGKFLKADGTWDAAGGGGGDTVYSTKTTSNSNDGGAVYIGGKNASQTIYQDPTTTDNHYKYFWALPFNGSETANNSIPGQNSINIGGDQSGGAENNITIGYASKASGNHSVNIGFQAGNNAAFGSCVCIGESAQCMQNYGVALGRGATTSSGHTGSVALGAYSNTTRQGEVYVGTTKTFAGYDSSNYRVLGGLYDGQLAHDAVTIGQINATIDAINTALSTNIPHIGA